MNADVRLEQGGAQPGSAYHAVLDLVGGMVALHIDFTPAYCYVCREGAEPGWPSDVIRRVALDLRQTHHVDFSQLYLLPLTIKPVPNSSPSSSSDYPAYGGEQVIILQFASPHTANANTNTSHHTLPSRQELRKPRH